VNGRIGGGGTGWTGCERQTGNAQARLREVPCSQGFLAGRGWRGAGHRWRGTIRRRKVNCGAGSGEEKKGRIGTRLDQAGAEARAGTRSVREWGRTYCIASFTFDARHPRTVPLSLTGLPGRCIPNV
jgi:hypothetical protein